MIHPPHQERLAVAGLCTPDHSQSTPGFREVVGTMQVGNGYGTAIVRAPIGSGKRWRSFRLHDEPQVQIEWG